MPAFSSGLTARPRRSTPMAPSSSISVRRQLVGVEPFEGADPLLLLLGVEPLRGLVRQLAEAHAGTSVSAAS